MSGIIQRKSHSEPPFQKGLHSISITVKGERRSTTVKITKESPRDNRDISRSKAHGDTGRMD